jgi:predicted nucleic acid-binding protein
VVIYPDTSFLVALYVDEDSSQEAREYMHRNSEALAFTPFHRLELRTALRLRVFRANSSVSELKTAFQHIDEDLFEGILQHTPLVWADALREAERIGEATSTQIGARSGDLLHVASAVVLGALEFVTFDQRQIKLARRAGLKVKTWKLAK